MLELVNARKDMNMSKDQRVVSKCPHCGKAKVTLKMYQGKWYCPSCKGVVA